MLYNGEREDVVPVLAGLVSLKTAIIDVGTQSLPLARFGCKYLQVWIFRRGRCRIRHHL